MSAIAARHPVPLYRRAPSAAMEFLTGRRSEALMLIGLLALAGTAHAYNMLNFPFYNDDEGIYISQAWAVTDLGRLAAYTYFYDHAPVGWIQIAAWSVLTGGFDSFGPTVATGRSFMLALQLGSTLLVYLIGRDVSGRKAVGFVAAALFALSPLGIEFHRRVLLDNIAAFWLLITLWLLVAPNLSLRRGWLSALALGVGILSKEILLFVVPALAYLAFHRSHVSFRWIALVSWVMVVGSVVSLWVLMAALKGELFPTGTLFGGTQPHVSLLETVMWQAGRDKDGGLFQAGSQFWREAAAWSRDEPVLILGGAVSALVALMLVRRNRVVAVLGLTVLSLVAFLGRGGVIYGFYIAPLLPLLALILSLVTDIAIRTFSRVLAYRQWSSAATAAPLLALLAVALTAMYATPRASGLQLWRSAEAQAQVHAVDWVRTYLGPTNAIMVDSAMWTDLHDPDLGEPYPLAHYYFKMGLDPEVRDAVFANSWENVDWVISTPPMSGDVARDQMELPRGVLENSSVVAHFDTGGWPQDVRRVHTVGRTSADEDRLLGALWSQFAANYIEYGRVVEHEAGDRTTSEGQSSAMLRAVYVDDRPAFDALWDWTRDHLQGARTDGLLASLWEPSGTGGTVVDSQAATDADQDTALALLFASARWNEDSYRDEARRILAAIWDRETVVVDGRRFLTAGPWRSTDGTIPINPSYFAPYAYRVFAEADTTRDWNQLVDDNYRVLERILNAEELGALSGSIPNWVLVDADTGEVRRAGAMIVDGDEFSYDAGRLQWRLSLDWYWNQDQRALRALQKVDLPAEQIRTGGRVYAAYQLDGSPVDEEESTAMYAWTVPALLAMGDDRLAHTVFSERILSPAVGSRHAPAGLGYYDANWAWFTTALLDGGLANLYAGDRVIAWPED